MRWLALLVLLVAVSARAGESPEPIATYRFQNSLAAEEPGVPALVPTADDERLAGRFIVDIVDGVPRVVYEMPAVEIDDSPSVQGLDLEGATLGLTDVYTLELLASWADTENYAKLADYADRVFDEGWYVYESSTLFYEFTDEGDALLVDGRYFLLTLTRAADDTVRLYIDGVPVASFVDDTDEAVVSGIVGLFIDDLDTEDENTTTRAARVSVFGVTLSPAAILARAEQRDVDLLLRDGFEALPVIEAPSAD